ncbi:MAG: hypothetical protein ACTSQY_00180 [Candidatus Odinarchaeia archaeon]|nr:MAG: hypothetical protein [Lokiarchaeota virus Fenrir Meg22_1012]URC17215.1 MAG: hypothetical protein [Lokiarchaeota virus Fenrir Meg22_1214]
MTSDKYVRDFLDADRLRRFNRLDPRLFQNTDDAGDGKPGLQKALRNWVKHYLSDGVNESDIDLNNNTIKNVDEIDFVKEDDQNKIGKLYYDDTLEKLVFENEDSKFYVITSPVRGIMYSADNGFAGGLPEVFSIDILTWNTDVSDLPELSQSPPSLPAGVSSKVYGFLANILSESETYGSGVIFVVDLTSSTGAIGSSDATRGGGHDYIGPIGLEGSSYGYFCGGNYISAGTNFDDIYCIDLTTMFSSTLSFASTATIKSEGAGVSGSKYGFLCGGQIDYAASVSTDEIEYLDLTTTTINVNDRGTLSTNKMHTCGIQGNKYGFICGGRENTEGNEFDDIEYIDITTTTGNALDSGTLLNAVHSPHGISGPVYGFIAGGGAVGEGDYRKLTYIDMTTTGTNAADNGASDELYLGGMGDVQMKV